ncbi:MAG: Amuc_1100 family pilus-like protein [Chthoniobacterales bacterium]
MKGFLQYRFFQIYLALVIIGGGGAGYFLYQSKSNLDTSNDDYAEAVKHLQTLQIHKPFPNEGNLKKLQQQQSAYKEQLNILAADLGKRELPLKEMTPQVFQEHLRQMVADFQKKAADHHVALPINFYLSFDRYKDSLPSAQATPFLGRQLESIALVINKLLDLKVRGILSVSRKELPEELNTPVPANKSIITLSPFNVVFVTDQSKCREAFNFILNTNPFFIIRDVAVANSQQEGPSRKEDAEAPSPTPPPIIAPGIPGNNLPISGTMPSTPPAMGTYPLLARTVPGAQIPSLPSPANIQSPNPSGETSAPQRIKVIVGRETLAVTLQIDQVNFHLSDIIK